MSTYLVIRKMQIHNANAMSSTYTIGVPAMTAWLGAVHALERKVRGLNQKKREDTDFSEIHFTDRKSTRLNSSHRHTSRMPSSA